MPWSEESEGTTWKAKAPIGFLEETEFIRAPVNSSGIPKERGSYP